MITLQQYITDVLVNIAEGVKDAKLKTDIAIATGTLNGVVQNEPQYVKFVVHLEVREDDSDKNTRGASLSVINVLKGSGGIETTKTNRNMMCQTVEFSVPIFLQAKTSKK